MGAVVSNKTIFQKKKSFAKAIADMHDAEVFGIGCDDKWRCLLKDYVILDVLETYKKKCYNPCFDFTVTNLGSGDYTFIIDNFNFDLIVDDEITFTSESLELLDTDVFVISNIYRFGSNDETDTYLTENGYSENSVILYVKKLGEEFFYFVTGADTIGSVNLVTPKEIINDNRELIQEDINCLIGKTC